MTEQIKKIVFDPAQTFSSRKLFGSLIAMVITISIGGAFWVAGIQSRLGTMETAISKIPDQMTTTLEANNNKLILLLDDRYEKKK